MIEQRAREGEKVVNDKIRIFALPFWRYAVVPQSLLHKEPAMPFYRKKAAMEFIAEVKKDWEVLGDYKMMLLRKRWFRQIELIGIY